MGKESPFSISSRTVERVKALPSEIRTAISRALVSELMLGEDPRNELSPTLMMLYTMIRFEVLRSAKSAL
ncbi:MAG: hypothetical protein NC336_07790 [Clostridium sp.]|nr:hypothetical protein [Clostridium sp.]